MVLVGLQRKGMQFPLHPLARLKETIDENLGFVRSDK